jgi:hypothetical protein
LSWKEKVDYTQAPVIGVLSQPLEWEMTQIPEMKQHKSYILAQFVDMLKA